MSRQIELLQAAYSSQRQKNERLAARLTRAAVDIDRLRSELKAEKEKSEALESEVRTLEAELETAGEDLSFWAGRGKGMVG